MYILVSVITLDDSEEGIMEVDVAASLDDQWEEFNRIDDIPVASLDQPFNWRYARWQEVYGHEQMTNPDLVIQVT